MPHQRHHRHDHYQERHDEELHPRVIPRRLPQRHSQAWWGMGAAYAPGFPIEPQHQHGLPAHFSLLYPHKIKGREVYPLPDIGRRDRDERGGRRPEGGKKIGVHVVNMSKRHVQFNLTPSQGDREKRREKEGEIERRPSHPELRRPTSPAQDVPRRPSHPGLRRPASPTHDIPRRSSHANIRHPAPADVPRNSSIHGPDLRRRPSHHNNHRPEPTQIQRPIHLPRQSDRPTVHIITYALKHTPHTTDALRILSSNLPNGTPHLYTIHAYNFTPPSDRLCQLYSGISSILQEEVMKDAKARQAVREAVDALLGWRRREKERAKREGRKCRKDVAISVCCVLGTHRSVSVAERIGREVLDLRGGKVEVRLVHVHRVKGVRDAY